MENPTLVSKFDYYGTTILSILLIIFSCLVIVNSCQKFSKQDNNIKKDLVMIIYLFSMLLLQCISLIIPPISCKEKTFCFLGFFDLKPPCTFPSIAKIACYCQSVIISSHILTLVLSDIIINFVILRDIKKKPISLNQSVCFCVTSFVISIIISCSGFLLSSSEENFLDNFTCWFGSLNFNILHTGFFILFYVISFLILISIHCNSTKHAKQTNKKLLCLLWFLNLCFIINLIEAGFYLRFREFASEWYAMIRDFQGLIMGVIFAFVFRNSLPNWLKCHTEIEIPGTMDVSLENSILE